MPHFTTTDGLALYFDDTGGADTPVLCLAGLTRNARDFDHVAPHLTTMGLRVIRMDYRGRGRSDYADPATYSIPQEAADALALLDHLGLARCAVLGTSRGGLIAMWIAATARARLTGVALNDIGPEIAPEGMAAIRSYIGVPPAQATYEAAARARAETWTRFDGVPHDRWLAEVRAHYDAGDDGLTLRYDPALAGPVIAAADAPAPDLWPLFDALDNLPLALIRGANSDLLSPRTAAEMARRRPDMTLACVPGRGHVPFLDEPESLAALQEWAAQLP